MLQKLLKCEVKAWLCWNLIIFPPLTEKVKLDVGSNSTVWNLMKLKLNKKRGRSGITEHPVYVFRFCFNVEFRETAIFFWPLMHRRLTGKISILERKGYFFIESGLEEWLATTRKGWKYVKVSQLRKEKISSPINGSISKKGRELPNAILLDEMVVNTN